MDSEPALTPAIIFSDDKTQDVRTGKLTLKGAFHRIRAASMPFFSTPFFATVFLTNLQGAMREVPLTLNIEDNNGQILATVTSQISTNEIISPREVAEISFPINPIEFRIVGHYRAVVLLDGKPIGSRGFNVTL